MTDNDKPYPEPDLTRWELSPARLRFRFDAGRLPFSSTAELPPQETVIGQERAVRAVDFGLQIQGPGYNLYVAGVPGTGKSSVTKSMIRAVAAAQPTPDDWCYVYNFQDAGRPNALNLPAGKGRELQKDMQRLLSALREELPKAFQSKDYESQRQTIEEAFNKTQARLGTELEERAREKEFFLRPTRVGILVVPMYKGKPMEPEQYDALDPQIKEQIRLREQAVDEAIRNFRQQLRVAQDDSNQRLETLNHRVALYTTEHFFDDLREKYQAFPKVVEYVQAVQKDVLDNFQRFLSPQEAPAGEGEGDGGRFFSRYAVNLIVDHGGSQGAPVVEEAHPSYANLIGRIERKARMGFLYTDFTLAKAGAILQANGGYLLLNILDVLRNAFSWDALKRVLKKGELAIEDVSEIFDVVATAGIKPEPIPVRLRVVLLGSPILYYLLQAYDEDFPRLFKVKADFDVEQPLTDTLPMDYARFIATLCHREGLPHFDREGVGAVIEAAARWAEHQKKLSLRFSEITDLVREAGYWAGKEGSALVGRLHVRRAMEERRYRSNLIEERVRELIAEGTILVDVAGAVTGQINGLSIHDLGDFAFGRPSRITARFYAGKAGVVNIEREAKLSGKVHNKSVMILAGFLGGRHAGETPLSLSATLAFEQSYGEVEGDSASCAELIALLSALADLPIRQDLAVTGSVNQLGQIQAVGGLNEKIEGFYAVCKALGLTGSQGVLVPAANVQHLNLKEEVVDAVSQGRFHIYAAATVDEALEILLGQAAGTRLPDGSYPEGTVNALVSARLKDLAKKRGKGAEE